MENKVETNLVDKKDTQLVTLENYLGGYKDQIIAVLPSNIPYDRFIGVIKTACITNTSLLLANKQSLFISALKCAKDGLLPDGRESAFVMFKGNVSYMPMIAGIIKKLHNAGDITSLSSAVVYEADEFDYELGDNEFIRHKPTLGKVKGDKKCVYAIAKTKYGIYREVMSISDIEYIRTKSQQPNGIWSSFWEEMAKKTVIRRLSKKLQLSSDSAAVIRSVDELYDLNQDHNSVPSVIDNINAEIVKLEPTLPQGPQKLGEAVGHVRVGTELVLDKDTAVLLQPSDGLNKIREDTAKKGLDEELDRLLKENIEALRFIDNDKLDSVLLSQSKRYSDADGAKQIKRITWITEVIGGGVTNE